jgi:DNA-binding NarL/FixJ family response regulator
VTLRVLIAEDQPLMRRGLRTVLELEPGFEVVGEAATGEQAVRQAHALTPDVVLMDVQMPGLNGVEATRQITGSGLTARVLILTTFDDEDYVLDGIRAGAAGYLLKDVRAEELCDVIRRVATGERFIQPQVAAIYLRRVAERAAEPPSDALTPRETEVVQLLARGKTNREISEALDLSTSTVKNHVNSILSKLRVRNRTEAALKAQAWTDTEA